MGNTPRGGSVEGLNVRLGSEGDICPRSGNVRCYSMPDIDQRTKADIN
jgi:hypothetical protein